MDVETLSVDMSCNVSTLVVDVLMPYNVSTFDVDTPCNVSTSLDVDRMT